MKRNLHALALAATCTCALPWAAHGYEAITHAAITSHAIKESVVAKDPTLIQSWGLTEVPFDSDSTYFDIYGEFDPYAVTPRITSTDYEETMISQLAGLQHPLSVASWFVRGVIREDDNGQIFHLLPPESNVAHARITRVLNHFFDPVHDRPLTLDQPPGVELGETAPDWALGTREEANGDKIAANHFSLMDAREAMWSALTLTDPTGRRVDAATWEDDAKQRLSYWKTAFRSFGGVLHLIQDMAQPQHTRNEAHSGLGPPVVEYLWSGHASVYESYMQDRTLAGSSTRVAFRPDGTSVAIAPLSYALISPIPKFPRYSDYWSTASRQGLADYSNHGFLTAAKNIGNVQYDDPPPVGTDPFYTLVPVSSTHPSGVLREFYLTGRVTDAYDPPSSRLGVPLARYSVWSNTLQSRQRFTLDRTNYDAMASLLVPRAVAYSAGLLNHFFRGRIGASLTDDGVFSIADIGDSGFKTVRAKLTNLSPDTLALHDGSAVAVATYNLNTCFKTDLSGQYGLPNAPVSTCRRGTSQIVTSMPVSIATLAADASVDLTFDFSANPVPFAATDLQLQIVYRGGLDQESDTVIAATLDIAEPTPFDIVNMTDFFLYDGRYYPIPTIFDASTVPSQIDPVLFNDYIDDDHNGVYDAAVDRDLSRRPLAYSFTFGGRALGSVTVPSSSYARMMLLMPRQTRTLQLTKLSFGYTVPVEIQPVIAGSARQDTPTQFRGKYIYQTSPDFLFEPPLVEVPADLPPVSAGPQAITITFDGPS